MSKVREEGARRSTVAGLALLGVALLSCAKLRGESGSESKPAGPTAASAPSAPAGGAPQQPQAGVCKVLSQKTWGSGANQRAGLTATRMDARTAVGFALGYRPHVLVFDANGEGKLVSIAPPSDSPLAKGIAPKEGERDLHRVTPAVDDAGRIHAYADYRDKYANEQRRIACGPVNSREPMIGYEGKALIDTDKKKPKQKPPEKPAAPAPSASAPPPASAPAVVASAPPAPSGSAAVGRRTLSPRLVSGGVVSRAAPTLRTASKKKDDKPRREIRDCRTVVDPGGKAAWAIGSELYGEPGEGDAIKWSMRFVTHAGGARNVIHEVDLPAEPDVLYTFESPVGEKLADGSYVLAGRYRGALWAWTLSSAKQRRSGAKVYRGGHPTLPHFVLDGLDYLLLVSQKRADESYELRFGRIDGQKAALPGSLVTPEVTGAASLAEPTLARAGNQRWLAYHSGKRREGELMVVPVDASLKAVGQPYAVGPSGQTVYESNVFGLEGGRLLVVYLRNSGGNAEVVSEVLNCEVKA